MKDINSIFSDDVEVPEIVIKKAEEAFEKIKSEDLIVMNKKEDLKKKETTRRIFKTQAAAVAGVCVLAVGSITAIAAVHHYWSRGAQGTIQATDGQQQELTNQGVAAVLSESDDYKNMAVTEGDITVSPETVIVDDRFAFVSFSVKGYELKNGAEPDFEHVDVYLGENSNAKSSQLNMESSFYNGIVFDEKGKSVYDDGSQLDYDKNDKVVAHYVNKDGDLEYVVRVFVADNNDSLLGKKLHVNFENLGTVNKAKYTDPITGKWNFKLDLTDVSAAKNVKVNQNIEGTDFVLDSIDISPISIRANYKVHGEVTMKEDENGVPNFSGVVLKDGTKLPYLSNGSMTGYMDELKASAYDLSSFNRVIDVDQIASILVCKEGETDMVEIPLN